MSRSVKFFSFFSLTVLVLAVFVYFSQTWFHSEGEVAFNPEDHYSSQIQPIFDGKCIACHSCYNSPCQLDLTSFAGLSRGASHVNLYDFPKIEPREPTRLYTDGNSVEEWREKGFYPVIGKDPHNLLLKLITGVPGIESGLQKEYDAEYQRICIDSTSEDQMEEYLEKNPAGRMPLGFPPLSSEEVKTLSMWMADGAKGPDAAVLERMRLESTELKPLIEKWESFFNGESLKQKITARYFYEHLFLAHLYFDGYPNVSFKLVRARERNGDINEIGTKFPFSDPEQPFYYRLRPVTNTMTHKVHIPFLLSDAKFKSWKKDFIDEKWAVLPKEMPPYGPEGSNPFETFKSIPRHARYKLFLDNSAYFIMTFIKGPVCRGQTALNVINDHFWVLFLDPDSDPLVQSDEVYNAVSKQTEFPAKLEGEFAPLEDFREKYWRTVKTKFSHLKTMQPLDIESVWSGEKSNINANITVFRHFDSATVLHGLLGRTPKTIWVLDYHVFETIYYNLSAGYNVFGPLLHQLNSRLYMEVSRVASEDLFLSFLPQDSRMKMRESWNASVPDQKESLMKSMADLITGDAREKITKELIFEGRNVKSKVSFKSTNYKEELLDRLIKERFSETQSMRKKMNVELFSGLNKAPAEIVQHLPDAILVLTGTKKESKLWTLIHNKDHYNVSMLLFEDDRRRPERDSLDIIEGAGASYANLIIDLREKDIEAFVMQMLKLKSKSQVWSFMQQYGLSRSDEKFWEIYNDVSTEVYNPETTERGYIDLNRYLNL